jgi:hypothetical protein
MCVIKSLVTNMLVNFQVIIVIIIAVTKLALRNFKTLILHFLNVFNFNFLKDKQAIKRNPILTRIKS